MDTCELCNRYDGENSIAVGEESAPTIVLVCWKCAAKLGRERCVQEIVFKILETRLKDRTPELVNFCVMVESGQGPTLNTDDTFFHGWQNAGGRQFENDTPLAKGEYMQMAKAAGVTTQGRVYQHGLARFAGDPEAWVGSRGEMKEILERRGWGCERLGVKPRDATQDVQRVGQLADDIVEHHVDRRLASIPESERTPRMIADTADSVRREHGGQPSFEPKRKARTPQKRKAKKV